MKVEQYNQLTALNRRALLKGAAAASISVEDVEKAGDAIRNSTVFVT